MLKDFINHRGYNIYWIYHAQIEYNTKNTLFQRYNKYNRYTYIDLSRAKELGLKVELI